MIPLFLAVPLLVIDLSVDDGGLVSGGDTGQWRWGVPTSGPLGKDTVWGTNLSGSYLNDATDTLTSQALDLSATTRPIARIVHYYDIQDGDLGHFEVNDGTGWEVAEPLYGYPEIGGYSGASGGWTDAYLVLSPSGAARFRFVMTSDDAFSRPGWYIAAIEIHDGDIAPPQIDPVETPVDTQDLAGPYPVRVWVVDDLQVDEVRVEVTANGATLDVPMVEDVPGVWLAEIPPQPPDTTVEWQVVASDGVQEARHPVDAPGAFRVFLAAPTDLAAPDGRLVGTSVPLSWAAPVSPHPVASYVVYQDGAVAAEDVAAPAADVAVSPDLDAVFTVAAVYDVGEGDRSEALSIDLEVPELLSVDPPDGHRGDVLFVEVDGVSLYLDGASLDADLGEGITVLGAEVRDANAALLSIEIGAEATAGPRDLRLTTGYGDVVFDAAFAVKDGDAPSILSVEPASVPQRSTATVWLTASEPFAGPVTLWADDGLLLAAQPSVDGELASVVLTVDAEAGVGEHVLVVDDGRRLWTATLVVTAYTPPPARSCATGTAPLGAWWAGLLALGAVARRRREPRPGSGNQPAA